MELVIDANILFSALIKEGRTEELMLNENICLFAPEFLLTEFQKYEKIIIEKTRRSKEEFQELVALLRKVIITVPNSGTKPYQKQAKKISPDPNDSDYFALALKLNCAIWSNDKKLKDQRKVKVYNTTELLRIFGLG